MEFNNNINYSTNKNIAQTLYNANLKNIYQYYNLDQGDNQYSIQFKQLIAYFNFRRKVHQYLSNVKLTFKTNVYDQKIIV